MYSTPLGDVLAAIAPLTTDEQQALLCDTRLTDLQAAFARVPDPRARSASPARTTVFPGLLVDLSGRGVAVQL